VNRDLQRLDVRIDAGDAGLDGFLTLPPRPTGLVVFAHGSGSSRFSTRNRFVADVLNEAGLATLLFDLLSPREHEIDRYTYEFRFDIPLLARRLTATVDWVDTQTPLQALPLGLFGASTGAAAALICAAERPERVAAVVSRGGRPDLAGEALSRVRAPTLLIVGGEDHPVLELNRAAAARLGAPHRLEIVPGATHLFEEPGTLEAAASAARDWFLEHLRTGDQ
jgi:pimeloyl-ACP methyl ester carboxylesterase